MESKELGEAVAAAHWSQAKTEVGWLKSQKSEILLSKMWISWVSGFYLWTFTKSMDCCLGGGLARIAWFLQGFGPPKFFCVFPAENFPETRPILRHTIARYISGWGFVKSRSSLQRANVDSLHFLETAMQRERENILNMSRSWLIWLKHIEYVKNDD